MSSDTARELLTGAFTAFTEKVHAVPDGRWGAPTPDTEWTVSDLLNHVVSEHLWAPRLLRGETIEQVGDRYDGDALGGDPVTAWDTARIASELAWAAATDEQTVHVSAGDTPAGEYAEQMLLDLTVHGWDLARGAGLDEAIDRERAEHVLAYVRPHADDFIRSGLFAKAVPTDSADPGEQLVALLGRDPNS